MTPATYSKFWHNVVDAYTQVAINHERQIEVTSDAEDLTAAIGYDSISDNILIVVGTLPTTNGNETEVVTDASTRTETDV